MRASTHMTTGQLISLIATKVRVQKSLVRALFKELAETAIRETKKNGVFVLPGIGRLVKAHRKARVGRNPATGEPVQTKSKTVVRFRVDRDFKRYAQVAPRAARPAERAKPEKHEVVRIFYATDREIVSGKRLKFSSRRNQSGTLSFGTCDVSIPTIHKLGNVERPSILRIEFRENPDKHFVIQSVTAKAEEEFYKELSGCVALSEKKETFVFIHGFKVSFDNAVYRTAQISHDLQFRGAPILYSWPSNGKLFDYTPDINNNDWTVDHLEAFLKDTVAKSGAKVIHVIAHSMGNRALTNALKQMALNRSTTVNPEFDQVILTAPDVDADIFTRIITNIRALARKITLYVSNHDLALMASMKKNGSYPRAGDSQTRVVVVPGVDTVDASAVDTNLIGHFYYAENRSVLSDIFNLFEGGNDPKHRFGIHEVTGPPPHWRFAP